MMSNLINRLIVFAVLPVALMAQTTGTTPTPQQATDTALAAERAANAATIAEQAAQIAALSASNTVITALQAAQTESGSLYNFVASALAAGQKIVFVGMTCPAPALWTANTAYLLGGLVTDTAGNVYSLASIADGTTASGTVMPTPTNLVDGGYTWTLVAAAGSGSVWLCPSSGVVMPTTRVATTPLLPPQTITTVVKQP